MDKRHRLEAILFITINILTLKYSIAEDNLYQNSYGYASQEYGYGPYHGMEHDGYMSDSWVPEREWGPGGRTNARCIDIPSNMSLCRNIGYNSMRLPNLLQHDSLREVLDQAGQWVPLLGRQCHPDTQLFLCSLFSPVCLDRPIYPCRSLCEAVKSGCEESMLRYGYPWPEMLSCDQYPLDNGLCIGLMTQHKEEEMPCAACNQPNTFEAIVDNYCSSNHVYRTKLKRESIENNEKVVITGKKIRKIKGDNPTQEQKRTGIAMHIADSDKCECGLGHDQSPDYYAMGNVIDGKFYASAFHLYERRNVDMKRALRAIRKKNSICNKVGMEIIGMSDQPQPDERNERRNKNRKKKSKKDRTTLSPEPTPVPTPEQRRSKPRPDAAEIAQRKAERAERRRLERLARKNGGAKQSKENNNNDDAPSGIDAIGNDQISKQRRNEGQGQASRGRSRERESRERRPSKERQN